MTRLLPTSDSLAPLSRVIRPQGSEDDSPACKARRAVSPILPEVSTRTASSTIVSSVTSYVGTATSNVSLRWAAPILPVSIPLPRFADKNFMLSPVRSSLVATQQYPSSPDFRTSTICVELDVFSSESS